jgi:precorrin-6B methylase 2
MSAAIGIAIAASIFDGGEARAQERFSLFVGSDPKNVERMVKLANLRDGDVVIDLGSGDGRIVFAAAQANTGVRGIGVDIDAKLVAQSNAAAEKSGISDRVRFYHRNVFDTDLSQVDVIFMWLFPELMRLLRPKILNEARPGTRVIAALWDMGSWPVDTVEKDPIDVNLWIVPAKVGGYWSWNLPIAALKHHYSAMFEQRFQSLEGVVRTGRRHGIFHDLKLSGEEISFTLMMTLDGVGFTRHEFTGRVQGDTMQGVARITMPPKTNEEDEQLESVVLPWEAKRSAGTAYFDPVGVNILTKP